MLALGMFSVYELVYRIIGREVLENHVRHQGQCPAQNGRFALRNIAAADIHLARLVWQSVNTYKSHQRLFGAEAAYVTNLCYELRADITPNVPITMEYSGSDAAKVCISFLSAANAGGAGPELGLRLLHQELDSIGFGHNIETSTGRCVMSKALS